MAGLSRCMMNLSQQVYLPKSCMDSCSMRSLTIEKYASAAANLRSAKEPLRCCICACLARFEAEYPVDRSPS